MGTDAWAPTTPERATSAGFDRRAAGTRALLRYGVLAGPFYLTLGLIQAFVRDGFDLRHHALSHLANGPGGWVQTANFVLTGLMVIAAAVGLGRVLRPLSGAVRWFLGGFGASMLIAAVFPADPVLGFPAGTPEGYPTSVSTSGLVHFIAGTLGFASLAVSCFVASAAMSRRREAALARFSLFSGLAVAVGFFGRAAFSSGSAGIVGIWLSVVVGWTWLAVMSVRAHRATSASNASRRPR